MIEILPFKCSWNCFLHLDWNSIFGKVAWLQVHLLVHVKSTAFLRKEVIKNWWVGISNGALQIKSHSYFSEEIILVTFVCMYLSKTANLEKLDQQVLHDSNQKQESFKNMFWFLPKSKFLSSPFISHCPLVYL